VSQRWAPKGDSKLLYEFLPGDSSGQTHSFREAIRALDRASHNGARPRILDLGCGAGASHDAFSARGVKMIWIGLDIVDSQEVKERPRVDLPFCAYDGTRIPFSDGSVDMVYSRQAFEHVRHPEGLLSEAHRVLRPGGVLVGSTSHLEPFHSRSYWNYTPYGFCVLLQDAGFSSVQVRPGIDSLTLIGRRCFSYIKLAKLFEPFFKFESPLNGLLELTLRLLGQSAKRRNAFKLLFAGQFCFIARK
jgi:SAM-dependent methyltransferase